MSPNCRWWAWRTADGLDANGSRVVRWVSGGRWRQVIHDDDALTLLCESPFVAVSKLRSLVHSTSTPTPSLPPALHTGDPNLLCVLRAMIVEVATAGVDDPLDATENEIGETV